MKLAIVTTGGLPVPATKGGAVENLLDFFLEENEIYRQVDIDVYSCYDSKSEEISKQKYPSTNFYFINNSGNLNCFMEKLLIQINKLLPVGRWFGYLAGFKIRKQYYDAILVENYPFHCTSLRRLTNIPILLHSHNRYVWIGYPLLRQYLHSLDGVICVSNFIARDAEKVKYKYGSKFNIAVAHNGIHIDQFMKIYSHEQKLTLRQSLGIKEDQKVILYTGRFVPAKGVKELLQAFAMLTNVQDYVLMIIGASAFSNSAQTPYIEEVKSIAQPIMDNVKFTDYIDYEKMPVYYGISDVQCVPSLWEEPAGLVSLEGMAAGLAIVCSDSGGTPEHVSDECAITVKRDSHYIKNLSKAIDKVLVDDDLRKRMGEAGRKRAELFSTRCYYNNVINAINGVMKK